MLKIFLAVAIAIAGFAAPASAKLHRHKNSQQTVKSGGRGGAHHGQRYGRTSQ